MRTAVMMSAILVCTPACAMSRSNGRAVSALGAVTAIGGGVLMETSAVDSDSDGSNETVLNDDLSQGFLGALLVVGGIVMIVAGLTADDPPAESTVAWAPTPPNQIVQPPGVVITPRTLPEVPVTPLVLQMAQQARSAAVHGHCDSAWYMVDEIESQDAAYAAALSAGPVLDGCPPPM